MRKLTVLLVFALAKSSPAENGTSTENASPIAANTQQLLLVRSNSWVAARATLQRYERIESQAWKALAEPIPVSIGRNGMAWGRGLHSATQKGPLKREGDGRAPAGAFLLERSFGAAAELPSAARGFNYYRTLPSSYCVEDVHSKYYNQLIDAAEIKNVYWERWSKLQREDGLFQWGIVVQQNQPEPKLGAGSCVFLHIWRGLGKPTAGCTAMPREAIEDLLRWLDNTAHPILVQLPESEYARLRSSWDLP